MGAMACQTYYSDVITSAVASQITSFTSVYSTVYSGADQRKRQSSASLAFVRGIHRSPVSSPHKWPVTRKMFPFDDVFMISIICRYEAAWTHKNALACAFTVENWQTKPFFVLRKRYLRQNRWIPWQCETVLMFHEINSASQESH